MQLKIKIKDSACVSGGKAVVLCDESGGYLPCQVSTIVENDVDGNAFVTVRFRVDGKEVAFE